MTRAKIETVSPFFIVSNVSQTIAFYKGTLGFEVMHQQPGKDPFFAIVGRNRVMIFLKHGEGAKPMPNPSRNAWVKWDAYLYVLDPDGLAAEFADNNAVFHKPLMETSEGLRGFEIQDPDGYVLFFGRPK